MPEKLLYKPDIRFMAKTRRFLQEFGGYGVKAEAKLHEKIALIRFFFARPGCVESFI